jgi:hypothetical protein
VRPPLAKMVGVSSAKAQRRSTGRDREDHIFQVRQLAMNRARDDWRSRMAAGMCLSVAGSWDRTLGARLVVGVSLVEHREARCSSTISLSACSNEPSIPWCAYDSGIIIPEGDKGTSVEPWRSRAFGLDARVPSLRLVRAKGGL